MTRSTTGPSKPDRRQPIAVLQLLRGIAALLVVTCHFLQRLVRRGMVGGDLGPAIDYLGYVGVALFFAISGFVMIYTTRHRFGHGGQAAQFIERRFLRVFPLYYVTTAAAVVFTLATLNGTMDYGATLPSLKEMLLSLLFIPYMNADHIIQPIYKLGWSLNFEMFFYALFAAAMLLPLRPGLVGLGLVLTGLSVLGTFLRFPADDAGFVGILVYFFTRPVLVYFLVGIGIGVLKTETEVALRLSDWQAGAICVGLLGCAAAGQAFTTGDTAMLQGHVSTYLAIALALAVAVFSEGDHARDGALARRFRHLGDVSYSLYLTHSFVLGAVAFVAARTGSPGPTTAAAFTVLAWGICIAVAHATWRWIERPAALWLSRRPLVTLRGGPADKASVAP